MNYLYLGGLIIGAAFIALGLLAYFMFKPKPDKEVYLENVGGTEDDDEMPFVFPSYRLILNEEILTKVCKHPNMNDVTNWSIRRHVENAIRQSNAGTISVKLSSDIGYRAWNLYLRLASEAAQQSE